MPKNGTRAHLLSAPLRRLHALFPVYGVHGAGVSGPGGADAEAPGYSKEMVQICLLCKGRNKTEMLCFHGCVSRVGENEECKGDELVI